MTARHLTPSDARYGVGSRGDERRNAPRSDDDIEEIFPKCSRCGRVMAVARPLCHACLALKQAIIDVTIAECERCHIPAPLVFGVCAKCDFGSHGEDY